MYLSDLSKEQKELFLDLVIFSMSSDGVMEEREKAVAQQYCKEMQTEFRNIAKSSSVTDVLQKLKDISSKSDLKKMTAELVALMYADDNFADEENELLLQLQKTFEFSSHLMGEIIFSSRHLILSFQMLDNMLKM